MANLRSVNVVILVGYLATDIKFKWVKVKRKGKEKEDTTGMASFNMATNETFREGEKKKVEFHRVIVWGKRAELCNKYLKKGSFIYIMGKLRHRSFKTADGTTIWITEVNAEDLTFMGKKGDYEVEEEPKPENKKIGDPF